MNVVVNIVTSEAAKSFGKEVLKIAGKVVINAGVQVGAHFLAKKVISEVEKKQNELKEQMKNGEFDLAAEA